MKYKIRELLLSEKNFLVRSSFLKATTKSRQDNSGSQGGVLILAGGSGGSEDSVAGLIGSDRKGQHGYQN